MDSRLPKLVFALLVLYAAIHFSYYYRQLPAVVASHFNRDGEATGWQTKSAFFNVFVAVSVLTVIVGFGIPKIIAVLPAALVNLPNKKYWLAPEHRAETTEFLNAYFAWFACALYLILIFTFDYAVRSNLEPEHPPDPAHMWYVLSVFVLFTLAWTARLLAKLLQPPRTPEVLN